MLMPLASHIVASEPAAEKVTGESDPERAAVALAALYGRDGEFIAVTGGDKGSFWYDDLEGEVRHMPAFAVDVVDTLAAGDVFHGAFAFGLARGYPMYQIMRFASAAAAIKCSRFGGRARRTDEIRSRRASFPDPDRTKAAFDCEKSVHYPLTFD